MMYWTVFPGDSSFVMPNCSNVHVGFEWVPSDAGLLHVAIRLRA